MLLISKSCLTLSFRLRALDALLLTDLEAVLEELSAVALVELTEVLEDTEW